MVASDLVSCYVQFLTFVATIETQCRPLVHLHADEEQQLHGVTYVESMKGFSLSTSFALARSMDSKEQKELMELPTNTFPMRIRGIYVTDQPWCEYGTVIRYAWVVMRASLVSFVSPHNCLRRPSSIHPPPSTVASQTLRSSGTLSSHVS